MASPTPTSSSEGVAARSGDHVSSGRRRLALAQPRERLGAGHEIEQRERGFHIARAAPPCS